MYTFTIKTKHKEVFDEMIEGFSQEESEKAGFIVETNTETDLIIYTDKTVAELDELGNTL